MKNTTTLLLIVASQINIFGQPLCGIEQVVDFASLGSFTTTTLTTPSITQDLEVTGSADINVLNLNGLGVVGGLSNNSLDYLASESMTFNFLSNTDNTENAFNISYFVPSAGQSAPANGFVGEHTLEAFDRDGVSLGVVEKNGTGSMDVSGSFGNTLISKFIITAINTDNLRVGSITFSMECELGLPAVHAEIGHIYIESIEGGLVIKSPNGDCWKLTIDNNGNIQSYRTDCSN